MSHLPWFPYLFLSHEHGASGTSEDCLYMIPVQIRNSLFQPDTVAVEKGHGEHLETRCSAVCQHHLSDLTHRRVRLCSLAWTGMCQARQLSYKNTCPYIIMSVSVIVLLYTTNAYLSQTLGWNKLYVSLCCMSVWLQITRFNTSCLLEMTIILITNCKIYLSNHNLRRLYRRRAMSCIYTRSGNLFFKCSSVFPSSFELWPSLFSLPFAPQWGYRRAEFPTVKGALSDCFLIISRACCETASAGTLAQGSDPFQAHTAGLSEPAQ